MPSSAYQALTDADFDRAFPNSRKISVEGPRGVRVPMREISVSGGEPPVRVYDTSGPRHRDLERGLPPLRREWIDARGDVHGVDGGRPGAYRAKPDSSATRHRI